MRTPLLVAALGALAAFGWQILVVHSQYGGNWTGLYYTGDRYPPPPSLAESVRVHPNSTGYDGQWYHYIAHDPLRRATFTPAAIAIYGFAAVTCLLPAGDFWSDPNGYGRILTPFFLLLALEALRRRHPAMALPMLLVTLRLSVQFARLAMRIVS